MQPDTNMVCCMFLLLSLKQRPQFRNSLETHKHEWDCVFLLWVRSDPDMSTHWLWYWAEGVWTTAVHLMLSVCELCVLWVVTHGWSTTLSHTLQSVCQLHSPAEMKISENWQLYKTLNLQLTTLNTHTHTEAVKRESSRWKELKQKHIKPERNHHTHTHSWVKSSKSNDSLCATCFHTRCVSHLIQGSESDTQEFDLKVNASTWTPSNFRIVQFHFFFFMFLQWHLLWRWQQGAWIWRIL